MRSDDVMDADVLADAVELARGATRVRARDRGVAARAELGPRRLEGDRAARRDACDGWLGGACAEPTDGARGAGRARRRPAAAALPRPPDELAAHELDGTLTVPMACESEGALEVYIEPYPARPAGRRRRSLACRSRADDAGARARVGRRGHRRRRDADRPSASRSSCGRRSTSRTSASDRRRAIVVATQGHYDDLALRAALATDAGYIGVVAAEKRASRCSTLLRDRGVDEEQLRRVHAPAGLDLGATSTTPRSRSRCSPTSSRGVRAGAVPCRGAVAVPARGPSTRCAA